MENGELLYLNALFTKLDIKYILCIIYKLSSFINSKRLRVNTRPL
jgi:hypothetical protein